jgi:hypothetical protein
VSLRNILKGKEVTLPEGVIWTDGDGNEHHTTRVRWYSSPANETFRSYAWRPQATFPDEAIPESLADSIHYYPPDEKPVFFGHYCLRGDRPALLAPNVACLDYCVTDSGLLCAYRWQGEQQLTEDNFACIRAG